MQNSTNSRWLHSHMIISGFQCVAWVKKNIYNISGTFKGVYFNLDSMKNTIINNNKRVSI